MSERLIPVTSEAQLKPGALVEGKPCGYCMGAHRFLIIAHRLGGPNPYRIAPGVCGSPYGPAHLEPAMRLGRLWIVDTGLEDAEPVRTARNRPKEAIR